MTALATIEQILAEGLDPAYIVFALPEWEHFHPTDLAAPIADWLSRHCPAVEVRRISSIPSPGTAFFGLDQNHDEITQALEIAPVFMIGFNEAQAEAFAAAWPRSSDSTSENTEFYFCNVTSTEDSGGRQYDAHAFYLVPDFPDVAEQNRDHPSE